MTCSLSSTKTSITTSRGRSVGAIRTLRLRSYADALAFIRLCVDPLELRAAYEAYAQVDVRDALERVQAVAIVLDHRGDRVLRAGALGEVAAALPRGSLRLLEGSAANPFRTPDWEAAALALEQFLDAPDPDSLPPNGAQSGAPQTTLTRRERDVRRLVVVGQRNRDIAAALDVAPATVACHVSNLLHKTGCSNRTELARYATDRASPATSEPQDERPTEAGLAQRAPHQRSLVVARQLRGSALDWGATLPRERPCDGVAGLKLKSQLHHSV